MSLLNSSLISCIVFLSLSRNLFAFSLNSIREFVCVSF
jgi:hypothetical protein